jgi:hypothetical protein
LCPQGEKNRKEKMKNGKIVCFLTIILVALFVFVQSKFVSASNDIAITVSVPKNEFRLGEIVRVDIGVKNTSNIPLQVSANPCIKVTAKKDNAYLLYAPPGSGFTIDGVEAPIILKPQQELLNQESVFWNFKPEVNHLNKDAAKPESENRILSDYAFSESGVYLIKGCTAFVSNEKWQAVDSDSVEITITDSVAADDLEAWNLLKQNGNMGYLLQVGDIPTAIQYKSEEREALLKEVDSLLNEYPNSFYAVSLRQSLDKFRAKEAKRRDATRSLKVQEPH